MIHSNDKTGVYEFVFNGDLRINKGCTIGYHVGNTDKYVKFNYADLPVELTNELAKATNKIARYLEKR